ncbi:MAG: GNAT family N-acetyltransferase, partial [Chlamydiota bacterium]
HHPKPSLGSLPQVYEQLHILQDHFILSYALFTENKIISSAVFETKDGITYCLSGIPYPFLNVVFGAPKKEHFEECIQKQTEYFNEVKMPFVWYLDEGAHPEFEKKLLDHGFQDGGIFRGVIGPLDKPIPHVDIPSNCLLELVTTESSMDDFGELVCDTFALQGLSRDLYKKALWDATKRESRTMVHWLARKDGKAVSAVSTLIDGDVVSFWNGASLPDERWQGLNTALRYLALEDAIEKGCHFGTSYLMSEGMALGICSKLGYQTKWRFRVFLAPSIEGELEKKENL